MHLRINAKNYSNKLGWYINDKKSNQDKHSFIKLLKNEKDGFYLETTNRRAKLLKKGLLNCDVSKIIFKSSINKNLQYKIDQDRLLELEEISMSTDGRMIKQLESEINRLKNVEKEWIENKFEISNKRVLEIIKKNTN